MKKQIYTFVAILIVLTVSFVTAIRAQSATSGRAHIPFDFSVRNRTMVAGDYIINRQDDRGRVWSLTSRDNRQSAFLMATVAETRTISGKGKMTFRRYGNKYFLAAVETSSYQLELPKSRAERQLEKNSTMNNLAVNKENREKPVIVSIEFQM